jgi:hypothetical protein
MQLSNFVTYTVARTPSPQICSGRPVRSLNPLRTPRLEGKFILGIRLSENSQNSLFQINQK